VNIFHSELLNVRLLLAAAGLAWFTAGQGSLAAPATIRRLDGSTISFADAASFSRKTLARARVTGAQIAVLDRGRLVWSEAFGLRRRDPELPMTRETTTWAASITKSVFAAYVMQLVERGEFSLDTPIVTQLPKPLDAYDEYRETASELVRDPAWPSVTPRILLGHTSGLGNLAMFAPDKKMRLHFKPGTRYTYSGDGLNLIQLAIEPKKGRPDREAVHPDPLASPVHARGQRA
jgi:CubicO group peptidase (beta-lactamase class C family)